MSPHNGNVEKEVKHPPRFQQLVLDAVSLPVLVIGMDRQILYSNPAADSIFSGDGKDSCTGRMCHRLLYGYDTPCSARGENCLLVDCFDTGGMVRVEYQHASQGDSHRFYEINGVPLHGDDGAAVGIVEVFHDITDWKLFERWLKAAQKDTDSLLQDRTAELLDINKTLRQEVRERQMAETALIKANRRFELLYRVIPSAIFTVDTRRIITSWNAKAEDVTGFSRDEIIGQPCSVFALDPCTEKCGVFSHDIEKPIIGRECIIKTKDGRKRTILKNADYLLDNNGNITGAVESFEDITGLKMVEEQLSGERDKLKGMISAMGQGMHILNQDYIFEFQNDVARDAFGDQTGSRCYRVYRVREEPCAHCLMHEAMETHTIQRTELVLSGNRHFELSYTPFKDVDSREKILVLHRDVTDEKIMHAEAMRAAQLASVGKLAAGVAHEINNPVNGIINYAQIIRDEVGKNGVPGEISGKIIREGERVAAIVSNLLSFARQQDDEFHMVYFKDVLQDAIDLIQHQMTKNCIALEIRLPDELPPVSGHHQQLQQVFLNLFINARFALNQRFSGKDPRKKIIISGTVIEAGGREHVQITFKDLGTGIAPELMPKIFEPFFSSKTDGEGTGLGLSICKDIISRHDGFLHVESEPGNCTTVIIGLPVYREAGKEQQENSNHPGKDI
jgi:PAS domain S-box-containing protein